MEALVSLLLFAHQQVYLDVSTKLPLNSTAFTVCQRLSADPKLNVCVTGSIVPVTLVPAMFVSPPGIVF